MIQLKAHAKINLTLDVLARLDDGYHRIESIKQQVGLHDKISLGPLDDIKVICSHPNITTKENLVFKTALLLKNEFNVAEGAKITIEKNIPLAAGLAGGSSDAAATLVGLNKLWKLELDEQELTKLAAEIGMDVPFSVVGGSCFAEGKGTKLSRIELPEMHVLLINPGFEVSTRTAYQSLDLSRTGKAMATKKLLEVRNMGVREISKVMHNDFEAVVLGKHSILKEIKGKLMENNALNAIVSGSGPTVFGLFEDESTISKAYESLKETYPFVFMTKTVARKE
ncbi:4-(cytidine 5'-diphospho)-2-C-methyl-D-erythritol kinase [Candidatus Woesearchaeota archaeon]|nr:4-(cytidine 5'-diphospho)-2-C-methyl-D-erythritol kinase [Candidatus Woesearchaeota archaeon]